MAPTQLRNLLTKLLFWLSLLHVINFLAWRQRIMSLACFANNVIHPCPQVMSILDREMPPEFTPANCLCHNYVCISKGQIQLKQSKLSLSIIIDMTISIDNRYGFFIINISSFQPLVGNNESKVSCCGHMAVSSTGKTKGLLLLDS